MRVLVISETRITVKDKRALKFYEGVDGIRVDR